MVETVACKFSLKRQLYLLLLTLTNFNVEKEPVKEKIHDGRDVDMQMPVDVSNLIEAKVANGKLNQIFAG